MAKFYKIEIQTDKQGVTIPAAIATYEDADQEVAARQAESAFYSALASMLASDQLSEFLCYISTETGYVDPKLSRFYKFPET